MISTSANGITRIVLQRESVSYIYIQTTKSVLQCLYLFIYYLFTVKPINVITFHLVTGPCNICIDENFDVVFCIQMIWSVVQFNCKLTACQTDTY